MALIPAQLKDILVCPLCHGELIEDEVRSVLRCPKDEIDFPVRDGIPIMLVPEGALSHSDAPQSASSESKAGE